MTILKENISKSLDVLFRIENEPSKKKSLLDKPKTVYIQIGLFKIPFVPRPIKRFLKLRHSLYSDDAEICLFVPNRKADGKMTTDEFIDYCVDYYTELLEKNKIKRISTVMPFKQLRSEYAPYEMRRKLVRRYDLFLCKTSLLHNHKFIMAMGKIFKDASREPLGVTFPRNEAEFDPEFQKSIDRALFASSFVINRASDNYTIPIGSLSHTKSELKENLETVLDQLVSENMIPGGVANVRTIYLWPSQSKPIPLFFNPELPLKRSLPKISPVKKRKRPTAVEGEISTQPGKKVMVLPNGEVFITNMKDGTELEDDSSSEESFREDSEVEDEEMNEKLERKEKDEEKSESEDDGEIEEREERLLREKKRIEEDEEKESVDWDVGIPKKVKMEKIKKDKTVKKGLKSSRKQGKVKEKKKSKEKKA